MTSSIKKKLSGFDIILKKGQINAEIPIKYGYIQIALKTLFQYTIVR